MNVLGLIIHFKFFIAAFWFGNNKGGSQFVSTARKFLVGFITACMALPFTVMIDRLFMKQQRVTNDEDAPSSVFNDVDTAEEMRMAEANWGSADIADILQGDGLRALLSELAEEAELSGGRQRASAASIASRLDGGASGLGTARVVVVSWVRSVAESVTFSKSPSSSS